MNKDKQYDYKNLKKDLKQHLAEAQRLQKILNVGISTNHPFWDYIENQTDKEVDELRALSFQVSSIPNPLMDLENIFELIDDRLDRMNENKENIISAVSIVKGEAFDIINNFLKNINHNAFYRQAENYFVKHPIKYFENNLLVVKNTHSSFDFNFQVLEDLVREIEEGRLYNLFHEEEKYFRKKFLLEKKEIILQKLADYKEESEVDNEERAEWDRADMLIGEEKERDN